MRILLICPYFPPENTIAAVRMGKFAQHWTELGHDVIVLSRTPISDGLSVPNASTISIVRVPDPLGGVAKRAAGSARSAGASRNVGVASVLRVLGRKIVWPDFYGPWAMRALVQVRRWRRNDGDSDVVVASVSPYSSLLLGYAAALRLRKPLVIDYRDMLAFGPYYDHGPLRTWIDRRIERWIARRAALVVGVSEPMTRELELEFKRPAATVTNGFDPADFEGFEYRPAGGGLRIVYCGQIYKGRRDLSRSPSGTNRATFARNSSTGYPMEYGTRGSRMCAMKLTMPVTLPACEAGSQVIRNRHTA